MKENKPYPILDEEDDSCLPALESAANVAYTCEQPVIPDDVDYAHIVAPKAPRPPCSQCTRCPSASETQALRHLVGETLCIF